MAHFRERHALGLFKNISSFSPLVGVFGHRQVGKTTFVEKLSRSYHSFDSKIERDAAQSDPELYLKNLGLKPTVIDECQLVPEIFSELKEYVRQNKKPGQIVLTGSVRFYSRKAIKESLTGRLSSLELLPLTVSEIDECGRAFLPLKLISQNELSRNLENDLDLKSLRKRTGIINDYASSGGLPGLFALRNLRLRNEKLKDQVELILGRDLPLVQPTTIPFYQILELIQQLAKNEARPVRHSVFRKETKISENTQKKLIAGLEAIFLLRVLPIEGDRKGYTCFFEDTLERSYLSQFKFDLAAEFEGLVFRNIRASFSYETGFQCQAFQFQDVGGRYRVPFAFRSPVGILGVIPITESEIPRSVIRSANRFLQRYNSSIVLIVTLGQRTTKVLSPRILQIPAERILFE